jgi:hypothetical protein
VTELTEPVSLRQLLDGLEKGIAEQLAERGVD